MKKSAIKIRLMRVDDFDAVVRIDEKVLEAYRPEYYRVKFETLVQSPDHLPTSLLAEERRNGGGFVMGGSGGRLRNLPEACLGYHRRRSRLPA